ncbi:PCDGD-like protein [Mya arenaria]|uniref:PCDGD-like protein n=1 Tax=Mya arenaria TaxID=6604 RepID=A0ABY7DE33_MYAAR|nr:PCDGD-like protein [Mya arenaria]
MTKTHRTRETQRYKIKTHLTRDTQCSKTKHKLNKRNTTLHDQNKLNKRNTTLQSSPPEISQPPTISISENNVAFQLLHTFNVTAVDDDALSCDVSDTSPFSEAFGFWVYNGAYRLYLMNDPGLDYSVTSSYVITVTCEDNYGNASVDVTVFVIPNLPPTFDNLPDTKFAIVLSVSGKISAKKDFKYAVDNAYVLTVNVNDGKDVTSETFTVFIYNVNTVPVINNLPAVIQKNEDTSTNRNLLILDLDDTGSGAVRVTFTVNPPEYTDMFYIHNKNTLKLTTSFNYEECSYFAIQFYASDDEVTSEAYLLTITVIDVNERCYFTPEVYYVYMYEGNCACVCMCVRSFVRACSGTGNVAPGFSVDDEDVGDTYTISIDQTYSTESTYFAYDATTGMISLALNYDVDANVHSTNVTLIFVCTDNYGLTGTATVSVTVKDVNDNVPTFGNVAYLTEINQYDGPSTTVVQTGSYVTDLGDNGIFELTWTEVTIGSANHFLFTPTGGVILKEVYLTSTTTVAVTSTTEETSFWSKAENIGLVAACGGLGVALASIATVLAVRICKGKIIFHARAHSGRIKYPCSSAAVCACYLAKFSDQQGPKKIPSKPTTKVSPKPNPKSESFDFWSSKAILIAGLYKSIHASGEPILLVCWKLVQLPLLWRLELYNIFQGTLLKFLCCEDRFNLITEFQLGQESQVVEAHVITELGLKGNHFGLCAMQLEHLLKNWLSEDPPLITSLLKSVHSGAIQCHVVSRCIIPVDGAWLGHTENLLWRDLQLELSLGQVVLSEFAESEKRHASSELGFTDGATSEWCGLIKNADISLTLINSLYKCGVVDVTSSRVLKLAEKKFKVLGCHIEGQEVEDAAKLEFLVFDASIWLSVVLNNLLYLRARELCLLAYS